MPSKVNLLSLILLLIKVILTLTQIQIFRMKTNFSTCLRIQIKSYLTKVMVQNNNYLSKNNNFMLLKKMSLIPIFKKIQKVLMILTNILLKITLIHRNKIRIRNQEKWVKRVEWIHLLLTSDLLQECNDLKPLKYLISLWEFYNSKFILTYNYWIEKNIFYLFKNY